MSAGMYLKFLTQSVVVSGGKGEFSLQNGGKMENDIFLPKKRSSIWKISEVPPPPSTKWEISGA